MKHINDLPEDSFIVLFSHIPLDELVKIRKVCKIWYFIVRQICSRKTSLKLFGSIYEVQAYAQQLVWYNLYEDNKLKLKSKIDKNDDELIGAASLWKLIGYLFPNVQSLVFYDKMNCFNSVLKSMPNLVSLTLRGPEHMSMFFSKENIDEFVRSFPLVNTLKSLKNLNLFAISNFSPPFSSPSKGIVTLPEMPILEQLETFSLCNYGSDCMLIIDKLGPNLRKLNLKNLDIKFDDFETWFLLQPLILKNITHLSVGSINEKDEDFFKRPKTPLEDKKLFHFICENFSELQCLEFKFHSLFNQEEVLLSLAKLNNLSELEIINFWNAKSDTNLLMIQLKSVKILHLAMSSYYGSIFPKIKLAEIFPNLEVLNITKYDSRNQIRDHLADLTCEINFIEEHEIDYYMGRHRIEWQKMLDRKEEEEQREERYNRWYNGSDSDDYAY